MRSIRHKLALTFSVFMVLLVLLAVILNVFFIQKYYIFKNRIMLEGKSKEILKLYNENMENFIEITDSISRNEGISTIVLDEKLNGIYNSLPPKNEKESQRILNDILKFIKKNRNILENEDMYTLINKGENTDSQLIHVYKISGGETLVLRKTIKSITESASIALEFSVLSGIILIIIGSCIIYIISKKATKPIINMSKIAEDISNLNFTNKVSYTKNDELGNLGKSINNISTKLSGNIDSLKEDVEKRKELVRNISHELKSPIGIIKGYTEGLKYGIAKDFEKQNVYYDVIVNECDRMDNLVKELLNLSKLEKADYPLNKELVNLYEVIYEINERLENKFIENGISIETIVNKNINILCDKNLIDRAITNYLLNAIKYISNERKIRVEVLEESTAVLISVFNTCENIDEKELERIWDVFYKGDKSRKRDVEGHGLGLSIVNLIASKHEGIAFCKNTKGGITFYIKIPK